MVMMFKVRTPHKVFSKIEHNGSKQNWSFRKRLNVARCDIINFEKHLVYIYKLKNDQFAKIIIQFRVKTPDRVFKNLSTTVTVEPYNKFKYSTLHCCQLWNVLSIYIQTTSGSVWENDYFVCDWNPVSVPFI